MPCLIVNKWQIRIFFFQSKDLELAGNRNFNEVGKKYESRARSIKSQVSFHLRQGEMAFLLGILVRVKVLLMETHDDDWAPNFGQILGLMVSIYGPLLSRPPEAYSASIDVGSVLFFQNAHNCY